MIRFFAKKPRKGLPISLVGLAEGLAAIENALAKMRVENGNVIWSADKVPTIMFGDDGAGDSPAFRQFVQNTFNLAPSAWGIEIDGTTATIYDCLYTRGPVSKHTASVAVADFDAVGDTVYLYARISTTTGVVEVLSADSIANATDATIPAEDDYFKKLLYRLERLASEEEVNPNPFYVAMDYRNALEMVARI